MTLRELVKEYREAHNLSQRRFAENCGLSNGYISMLERNLNPKTGLPVTPSLPALKKIANGMGITLTELFTQADDMPIDLLIDRVNETSSAPDDEGGLDMTIIRLLQSLPESKKDEALNYIRYLAESAGK